MLAGSRSLQLTAVCACLLLAGCTGDTTTPTDYDAVLLPGDVAADQLDPQVAQVIAHLRARTAAWHNPDNADDAGYTVPVGCTDERTEGLSAAAARGMGYHTLNLDLLDGKAHVLEPEMLVYAREPASGDLKLAGFDYFIPAAFYPGPDSPDYPGQPPILEGVGIPMNWHGAHGGWAAHTWPWMYNPDGMFDDFNPSVALCECEISPETSVCTP